MVDQKDIPVNTKSLDAGMTLSALLRKFPDALDILVKHGLLLETLDEVKTRRKMSEKQYGKLMGDLSELTQAVRLTEAARKKILGIMKDEKKEGHALRIRIVPSGFGFGYEFAFEKDPSEGDTVLESGGVRIYIDRKSLEVLRGSKIDFVSTPQGEGFRVDNPNVPSHGSGCSGCGSGGCS